MTWILILIALAAGAANPLQTGANAQLNKQLGHPLWATLTVYGSGLLGCLLLQLFVRQSLPSWSQLTEVRWWAWLGGLISIVSTVIGLTLAHRLGSSLFTGLSVTASLVTSLALDQFGMLGFDRHAASPARFTGAALMIAGVWLMTRG